MDSSRKYFTTKGSIFIGSIIISFILLSVASLIFYKIIYLKNLSQSWIERKSLLLEIDSLLIHLEKKTSGLSSEDLDKEIHDFLTIKISGNTRWKIIKRAKNNSENTITFDFYFVPKQLHFRRVI